MYCWGDGSARDANLDRGNRCHGGHSELDRGSKQSKRGRTFSRGLNGIAQAMSLGTTPMIGFDPVGVSREFSLSDNEVPALLVAVGYPTEANWPQKPRRPISDVLAFA